MSKCVRSRRSIRFVGVNHQHIDTLQGRIRFAMANRDTHCDAAGQGWACRRQNEFQFPFADQLKDGFFTRE